MLAGTSLTSATTSTPVAEYKLKDWRIENTTHCGSGTLQLVARLQLRGR